jgi:hypothetical protein
MARSLRFIPIIRVFVAMLAAVALWPASAALTLEPPEVFFTNVADRLLQQQLGLRLTDVQIAPTNQYNSAVHRIFQVTANIYDATTTNDSPAVFRPLFNVTSNGVFLSGFTNDASLSTFPEWLESNPYGVPMVIAARRGVPNFNEFSVRSDITVQRKLQVVRTVPAPTSPPVGTNQMYLVGISNHFGVESWNSSFRRYPRAVTLSVSNYSALTMSNGLGMQTNAGAVQFASKLMGTNTWGGFIPWVSPSSNSFVLALNTNQIFLSNAVYRFANNTFANGNTNAFEADYTFPIPYWELTVSNRLTYLMSDGDRILDVVLLNDSHTVDLHRELLTAGPYFGTGASPFMQQLWNTNRTAALGPPVGVLSQIMISLGAEPTTAAEWRAFTLTQTVTENDKATAIDRFRVFCGLPGPIQTNTSLTMETPFNPAAKVSVVKTWRANDPLVHFHPADLKRYQDTNHQYLKPIQVGTNLAPSTLGKPNDIYSPWGGSPGSANFEPFDYDRSTRDPGAYSNDDWNFPSNAPLVAAWLGRIHRGTPWQSIYLKADAAPANAWLEQHEDLRTHPTNDWRMAALLAELFNTNEVQTLTSINAMNFSTWTATLSGLITMTNTTDTPIIYEPAQYDTNVIIAGSPQLTNIMAGITRTRTAQPGQYFADVAAFLSVPELSSASPWLNLDSEQQWWALTDAAYEILPSQLLSLVRRDPVATISRAGPGLELRFTVFDGYAYRVEASTDGAFWSTVSEPHFSTNSVFTLTVPATGQLRFFRAVLP